MSKQKMEHAKALIQEKKYDQARSILETVDHPTATKWLARLDEIAPKVGQGYVGHKPVGPHFETAPAETQRHTGSNYPLIVAIIGIVILALFGAYVAYSNQQEIETRAELHVRTWRYCGRLFEFTDRADVCWDWAGEQLDSDSRFEIMNACHQRAGALDTVFRECMIEENILPPGIVRSR